MNDPNITDEVPTDLISALLRQKREIEREMQLAGYSSFAEYMASRSSDRGEGPPNKPFPIRDPGEPLDDPEEEDEGQEDESNPDEYEED
jgi:hypothetical protein